MKRFITAALIALIAPAAMAGSCLANSYDRNFFISGDATLPPLKILSVTPGEHPNNLPTIAIKLPQVLELAGFKTDTCDNPHALYAMAQTTSDSSLSKSSSTVTVRVGYDNTHYTDLMIYIHQSFFGDFKTSIVPVNPQPNGITYQMKSIPQGGFGDVSLHFTKQGN